MIRPVTEQEQNEQRKNALRAALAASPVPVPDDLLNAVAGLFVTDTLDVLRAHPGFDLEDKLRSIRTTLQLFDQAFADLQDALAAFDAFSRQPEFHYRSHRAQHDIIERSIRKEIFTFSELAHSLQDHCRRVNSRWKSSLITPRIPTCFGDDGLHDFVCGLRTALHHLLMLDANWAIRGSGAAATSHYLFDLRELQDANPSWNERARRFLAAQTENIDIGTLTPVYHQRVHEFYDAILDEADANPPAEVADYRRCWNAHQRRSARMAWNFMLTQYQNHGIDPYLYLDRYLLPTELETVRRLPDRSRTQVDFIIRALDELSACDDALRLKIYRFFGVPEEAASRDPTEAVDL
ncbi:hypothetical protein IB267_32825 [Ensifer sp. ENS09]|uniref:hypothetical protein n=1 Tax=Ensifer sp. ENS09 TaxID=2769263 RepID=UPI00177B6B7A|nr:hypothetical protein [Ensifer sp. ENS09]MBD9653149.1 hypothetical protein [Ensifer sp. ENS09]